MEINGMNSLLDKLEAVKNSKFTEMGIKNACLSIERDAKKKCPTGDGTLRASITHNVDVSENEITGEVGTNTEYAPYVEFGTGLYAKNGDGRKTPWSYCDANKNWHTTAGQQPQPFLYPALEEYKDKISADITKSAKGELNNL